MNLLAMTDDAEIIRFLLQRSERYAQLYPSLIPRMMAAYESGNPAAKQAVIAMGMAMSRGEALRERRLGDEHGLTPTEVRVALHLVDGGTVASCADQMEVAESTVRWHVKSIFAKTGIRRQADLRDLLKTAR